MKDGWNEIKVLDMKVLRGTILGLSLLASAMFLSGCLAMMAGGAAAGTVAYVRGDSEMVVDGGVDRVRLSAVAVADELGLVSIQDEGDQTAAHLIFRNALDEKLTVTLESVTDTSTRIRVRHGIFGDRDKSTSFLTKVASRLE